MSDPSDPKIDDGGGVSYQPILDDDLVADEAPPADVADTPSAADPDRYIDVLTVPLLQMAGTGGAQGKGGASAINQPQTDPLLIRLAEFHNVALADIKTLARLYVYIFDKTAPVLVAEGRIPTLRDLFRLIDLTLVLSVQHDFLNLFEAIKLVLLNQFTKTEVREQIFRAVEEVRGKVAGIEQGETPKEKLKRKLRYWVEDGLLTSPEDMLHKVAADVGLPLRSYLFCLFQRAQGTEALGLKDALVSRTWFEPARFSGTFKKLKLEYKRLLQGDNETEESMFTLLTETFFPNAEMRKKIVAYYVAQNRETFLARVIEFMEAPNISRYQTVACLNVLKELGENAEILKRLKKLLQTSETRHNNFEVDVAYSLLADVDPDFKRRLEEYRWSDIQEAISELMAEQVAASDTQKIFDTHRIVFSLVQTGNFSLAAGLDAYGNPIPADVQDILTSLIPKEEALFLVGPTLPALQLLAAAIARKHPVYLEGETGTGKNAMLRYLANLAGVPLFRLNFGQETDNEQLYGHYEIQKVNGKRRVVLTDGKMIQAIKYGGWVLWDEANLARPGFLVAQNDVVQQLATGWVWVRQGGELKKIRVHDNFRLFATGNPEGYADRQSIEKSFGDRWVRVKIREFGKKATQAILAKLHPDLSERTITGIVGMLFAVQQVLGRRGAITLRTAKRVTARVSEGQEAGSQMRAIIQAIEAEVLDGLHAREKAEAIAILNEKLAAIFPLPRGEGVGGGWTPSDAQVESMLTDSQLDNTLTGVAWGVVDLLGDHDLRQKFDVMVAIYSAQADNAPQPPLSLRGGERGSYAVGQIIPVPTTLHYATKVLDSLIRGDFLLLEGPPAISKSAIPRWIAELTGREIIEVTGSHDTTVADLVGMPTLDADGNLVFEDGYFTEAIKRDCILLINEANLIKASVMERLNSLFDDDRDIFIIENGVKKPLKLGPNFRLILTQNPEDMRGGRMRLSPALENKLRKIVFDRNFQPLELQAMITVLAPSLKDYAATMVDAFTKQNISLTLRDLKRWIGLTEALAGTSLYDLPHALKTSAQLVFFSRFAQLADQTFVDTMAPYTQALLSKDAIPLQTQHVRDLVATLTPTLPLPPSPQGRENKMATTLPSPSRGEGQGEGVNAEHLSFIQPTMESLVGLVAATHANVPVYLEGETGTGKNAMLRYLAYEAGVSLVRLNFGLETDNEQLFGGYEIQRVEGRRRVVLTDGKMIQALEHGEWVVWDEVNLARSGFLVSLNDFVQQLESGWVWVRHGGKLRRLQVHKNFRLFATGNPEGYADRQSIEKSFGDRWLKLYVQEFNAEHLQALLADSYPALDSQTVFHIVDMLMALKLVIGRRGVITVRTAKRVAARVEKKQEARSKRQEAGSEGQDAGDRTQEAGSQMRAIIQAIEAEVLDGLHAREKAEAISALNTKLAEIFPLPRGEGVGGGWTPSDAQVEAMLTDSLVDDILAQVAKGEQALLGDHELRAKFDAMIASYRLQIANAPQPPLKVRGGERGSYAVGQIIPVPTTLHYAIKVLDSLIRGDFVLLEGPPAISKSAIPQWIGALTGQKVIEVTGTKDMDVSDLLGMPTLDENGDLKFQDGFFLEAIKHGYLLVINEANLIRAGVLERLNSVFDEDRMIYVLENGVKQPIAIHKNFRLILTQNPADMRGGRAQLSPALENKLRKIVFNRNFHPLELQAMVQELYPELAIVSEEIVHAYTKAQDALTKEGEPITLRNLLQWLEMSTLLGAESTLTPDQALILGGEIVFKARNVATREKIAMLFYRLEEQVGGKLREQARTREQEAGNRRQEARGKMQQAGSKRQEAGNRKQETDGEDQLAVLRRQIADVLLEDESGNVRMVYEHLVARRGWHNLGVWFYAILPHIKEEEALALLQSLKVSRRVFYGHLLTLPRTPAWVVDFILGSLGKFKACVLLMATDQIDFLSEDIKNDPRYAQRLCELLADDRVFEEMGDRPLKFLLWNAPAAAYDYLRNLYAKNYLGAQSARGEKISETPLRLISWLPYNLALELLQIFYRCNRSQKKFPCEQSFMIELGRLPLDLKKDLLFEIIAGEVTPAPKLLEPDTASEAQYTLAEWTLLELSGEGEVPLLTRVKEFSGHPCIRSWVFDLALARLGDGEALASIQSKFTAYFSQFQSSRRPITELRVGVIPDLSAYEAVQMAETLAKNNHLPAWEFLEELLRDPLQVHPKQTKIKTVGHIHTAVLEALSRLGGERADGLITWFFETRDPNFATSREDEVYLTLADEGSFDKIPLSLQPHHEIPLLVRAIDNQKLQHANDNKPRALLRLKKLDPDLAQQKARQVVENKLESARIRVGAYKLLSAAAQKELIHLVYEEVRKDDAWATWIEVLVAVEGQAALPTLRALWEKLDESHTRDAILLARLLMQLDPNFAGAEAKLSRHYGSLIAEELQKLHGMAEGERTARTAALLEELEEWGGERAGSKLQEAGDRKQEAGGEDPLAALRRQIAEELAESESGNMRAVYEHLLARRGWFDVEQWFATVAPHLTREECEALQTTLAIPQDKYLEILLTLPHMPPWVVDYFLSDVDMLLGCLDSKSSEMAGIPEAIKQDARYGQLLEELLLLGNTRYLHFFFQDCPDRAYAYLYAMYSKQHADRSENENGVIKFSLTMRNRLSPERALTLLQSYFHNQIPDAGLRLTMQDPMVWFRPQLDLIPHSLKRDFLVEIVESDNGRADSGKIDGYTLAEWAVMELAASGDAGFLEKMRSWESHPQIRPAILHLAMAQLGDATGLQLTQSHFDSKPVLPRSTGLLMAEILARHGYKPAWEFLEQTLARPFVTLGPAPITETVEQNKIFATGLGVVSKLGGARGDALLDAFMKRQDIVFRFNEEGSLAISLVYFKLDLNGEPLQLQPRHEICLLVALIKNPTRQSELAIVPSALARLALLDVNLAEQKARELVEDSSLDAYIRSEAFKYLSEDARKELIHIVYEEIGANRDVVSWVDVLVEEEGTRAIPILKILWEKVDESKPTVAWKLAGHLARLDPEWGRREAEMSRHYSRLIAEELHKSHGMAEGERAERTTELLGELEGWEGEEARGKRQEARGRMPEAGGRKQEAGGEVLGRAKIARMLVEQNFMSLPEIHAAVAEVFGVEVDAALAQTILELINLPYTNLIAMAGERVNARLQGLRGHNLQDAYGKPLSYEKIQWLMSLIPPAEKLSMIGPTTQALEWLFGAIKSNFPIYLEGETGIGKNAILRFLAHKTATPLMRINFGTETDNEQLYGGYEIQRVDGKRRVVLTDGKMIQALQYGAWVVWDEVNLARAGFLVAQNDIVQQLRSGSVWVRRGGRVEQIPVHVHFRLFATGNPQGYAGRQVLEKSFGNRWIKLILSPFKKEETRLIMAESYPRIPEQTLNFVVNTLHELRRAIGGNFEISIRTYKRVCSRVEEALQMIGAHDLWDRGADGLPVLTAKGMGLFLQAMEAEVLDGLDTQTYQVALNTLRVALPRGEHDVHDFVSEKFLNDIFSLVDRGEASLLGDHALRAKFDVLLGQYGAQIYNSSQPPLKLRGGERGSYAFGQIVPVPTTLHYATKVLDAFLHKQFIILEGPPSVSKTEIPKWLGSLVGQEVIEVTGTKEKSVADLLGMPTLDEDGNIVFKEGYLLKALQTGAILILNEANLLQAAVLERLNSLFDDDREILVVEGNHKVPVKIHENFRLVLTQNPADMRGGRNQFSPALVNKLRRIYFRRAFTTLELEAIAEARIRGIFGDTYGGPGGISVPSAGRGQQSTLPHLTSPYKGEEISPLLRKEGLGEVGRVFQTVFGPQKKDGVPDQDQPPRISEEEIAAIEKQMRHEAAEFMREHGHHLRAMSALAALRHVEIKVDQSGGVDIAAMDLDNGVMYINPAAAKNLTPHQLLAIALHEGGHGAISRLDREQFFFKDELRHFLANCLEDPRVNEYILSRLPGARADFKSLYGEHFPDPQLIADADRLAKIRPLGGLPHEQFALAFIDLWANGHLTDRVVHPQIRTDLASLEPIAREIWAAFPTEDPPRRRTVVAKQEFAYDLIKENIYPVYLKYVEESKKMIMDALQQMKDAGDTPSHIPAAGGAGGGRSFPIDWNDLDESARRILAGRAEEQAGWFEPSETSGNRARQVGEAKRRGEGERQKGKAGEGRYRQEDFDDFGQKTLADILQDRARDQAARQEFYDGHPWRKYFDPVRNVAEEVAEALRQLLHLNDDFIWDDFFHTSGPKLSIKRTIQMILRDEFGILTAEDLKIFLRKNFPTRRSHRFVLVLDESGSMKGGAQDSAIQAMAMFEYVMQELAMQYGVVGFDDVADVHKDFGEDFTDKKAKDNHMYIMETAGGGGTNDYEGIKLAHEMLGEGRQLVIGLGIGAGTEAVAEVFDHYYQSDSFAGLPTQLTQILVKYLLSPDAPEDIILVVTDGAGVEETKDLVARIEGREKKAAPTKKTASFVLPKSHPVSHTPAIQVKTNVAPLVSLQGVATLRQSTPLISTPVVQPDAILVDGGMTLGDGDVIARSAGIEASPSNELDETSLKKSKKKRANNLLDQGPGNSVLFHTAFTAVSRARSILIRR